MVNVTAAPPVTVGVFGDAMATPFVYTAGTVLYLSTLGFLSLTVILNEYFDDPPVLVAVTANSFVAVMAVGVPVITPVSASSAKPTGSAGVTVNVTAPPCVIVGVFGVAMISSLVYTAGAALYLSRLGALSSTVMLTEYIDEPPEFVTVIS